MRGTLMASGACESGTMWRMLTDKRNIELLQRNNAVNHLSAAYAADANCAPIVNPAMNQRNEKR